MGKGNSRRHVCVHHTSDSAAFQQYGHVYLHFIAYVGDLVFGDYFKAWKAWDCVTIYSLVRAPHVSSATSSEKPRFQRVQMKGSAKMHTSGLKYKAILSDIRNAHWSFGGWLHLEQYSRSERHWACMPQHDKLKRQVNLTSTKHV